MDNVSFFLSIKLNTENLNILTVYMILTKLLCIYVVYLLTFIHIPFVFSMFFFHKMLIHITVKAKSVCVCV